MLFKNSIKIIKNDLIAFQKICLIYYPEFLLLIMNVLFFYQILIKVFFYSHFFTFELIKFYNYNDLLLPIAIYCCFLYDSNYSKLINFTKFSSLRFNSC